MPFRSKAQQRFLFARHPDIAERWAHRYGVPKNLPQHTGAKRGRKDRRGRLIEAFVQKQKRTTRR